MIPDSISENINLQMVDPVEVDGWDDTVLKCPEHTFFHSQSWARALKEAYGYKPVYFVTPATDGSGRFARLLPMMDIDSFLTGRRGVSLPFTDSCRPVVPQREQESEFRDMLEAAAGYGRNAGWKYLEIRDGRNFPEHVSAYSSYYRCTSEFLENEELIFKQLQGSTKRNIRKAGRGGLSISVSNSLDSVLSYYKLHGLLRKRHGLPSQPLYFFKSIHKNVIYPGNGFVVLASYKGKPVSGAVFFHFGKKAVYKYGASDLAYQHLRGNDLVMWEAIRLLARNGFHSLCFGRTDMDNEGLRRFKSGWGTKESIIRYFKIDLKKDMLLREGKGASGLAKAVMSRLPVPALNIIGHLLYRHIG